LMVILSEDILYIKQLAIYQSYVVIDVIYLEEIMVIYQQKEFF